MVPFERLTPYSLKTSKLDAVTLTLEPWGEDAEQRFRPPPPDPDDPGIRPGLYNPRPHLLLSGKEVWQKCREGSARWDPFGLELDPGTPEHMVFRVAGNQSAIAILRTTARILGDASVTDKCHAPPGRPLGEFYYLHQESVFSELSCTERCTYMFFRVSTSESESCEPQLYEFVVSRGPGHFEETHLEEFFEKWKAYDLVRPQLAYADFFNTRAGKSWATKFAVAWARKRDLEECFMSTDEEPRKIDLPPAPNVETQFVVAAAHRVEQVLDSMSNQLTDLQRVQVALFRRVGILQLLLFGVVVVPLVLVLLAVALSQR